MIRGWYYNRNHGQRFLTIEEITRACNVSIREIDRWLADRLIKKVGIGELYVDAGDVVSLLIRNCMAVPASLLPPNTKKILFVAEDDYGFQDNADRFDLICRFFADSCNILVETVTIGGLTDGSMLALAPDLVVIFFKSCDQGSVYILNPLSNMPDRKMALFVDESSNRQVDRYLMTVLSRYLLESNALHAKDLVPRLRLAFDVW